ncbi:hypothetical protein SAMN05443252_1043 [Bacillus sp. OV322]|uniref:hypothetical protein n=1 Tax=Bacillus sp. OV322 TaxID=1882764 RepID=UPI0008E31BA7|nr:hypothetical protein [Bacillus sp. OV322]SFC50666.1 hypothetical protein SAMN05443252_1043 [Bacillus sp. OV322]
MAIIEIKILTQLKGAFVEERMAASEMETETEDTKKVKSTVGSISVDSDKKRDPLKETMPLAKTEAILELLRTDLKTAKKVWAILHSDEEVQVENNVINHLNGDLLGSNKANVEISMIKSIKFRGKLYLN